MIADELDATRTIDRRALAAEPGIGLMADLEDLGKHAAQVADRLDQLRTRLGPVLADLPMPAAVDEMPTDPSPAQHKVRVVAVTLHSIDDQISFLLDGIRL